MVITTCDKSSSRRAANRRRVKAIVPEAIAGQFFQGQRLDRAAERACLPETNIVQEDNYYVRRSLGRRREGGPCRLGIFIGLPDLSRELRLGKRQFRAIDLVDVLLLPLFDLFSIVIV